MSPARHANPVTGTSFAIDPGAEVHERVATRLRRSPYIPLRAIRCECGGGVLRLQGSLPTFYLKQIAQETVKGVEGVREIVNQIEVPAPPCEPASIPESEC